MGRYSRFFLTALLISCISAYARRGSSDFDKRNGSFEEIVANMPKPPQLTPEGKKQWRKQRAEVFKQLTEATNNAFPEKTLHAAVIKYIRSALYGNERCYHSDDIQKYVSEKVDLKSYEEFVKRTPSKDKNVDIYAPERRKIEDRLLQNDEIKRKKDLEKELHEKYRLCEDKEKVVVTDIRGKKYEGTYRKERTTEKLIRVGQYPLSRFDLTLESRARFWQKDHDEFVKKEVRRLTRKNTFVADEKTEDGLDGRIQQMYLDAGYLPNIAAPTQEIFAIEPKYWFTHKELAEIIADKIREEYRDKLMKGRGYVLIDIGDGTEYAPKTVEAAFDKYLQNIAKKKAEWNKRQQDKNEFSRNRD